MKWIYLVVLALVLVSCGEEQTEKSRTVVQEVQGSDATPNTPSKDAKAVFQSLVSGIEHKYKVTYQTTITTQDGTQTMQQTFVRAPGKMKAVVDMPQGQALMFKLDSGLYNCAEARGRMMCYSIATMPQEDPAAMGQGIEQNLQDYTMDIIGRRTIAGVAAQCFRIISSKTPSPTEMCYSDTGVLLALQMKSASGEVRFEATSYSTTVSDAEFTLPAEPIDLPMSPGGMPALPPGYE